MTVLKLQKFDRFPLLRIQSEHKRYLALRPNIERTLNLNHTIHHIHNIFGDCHSESRPLYPTDRGIALPLKRLENMGDKLLAHANPRIPYMEFVIRKTLRRTRLLSNPERNRAARHRIFDRVAQKVEQYLVQSQLITIYLLIEDIDGVHIKFKLLRIDIPLDNILKPMQNLRQAARLFFQVHLSALNPAHIKHIINQAEQMVPR